MKYTHEKYDGGCRTFNLNDLFCPLFDKKGKGPEGNVESDP